MDKFNPLVPFNNGRTEKETPLPPLVAMGVLPDESTCPKTANAPPPNNRALSISSASPRLRAPKKMIRARFAAESSIGPAAPVTPTAIDKQSMAASNLKKLKSKIDARRRGFSLEDEISMIVEDATSVISKEEYEETTAKSRLLFPSFPPSFSDASDLKRELPSHPRRVTIEDIVNDYKFSFGTLHESDVEDDTSSSLSSHSASTLIKDEPEYPLPSRNKRRATTSITSSRRKGAKPSSHKCAEGWEEKWMTMFRELVEYKKKNNGSTQVSQHAQEYHRLGDWVKTQRRQYVKNQLSERRVKLLDSIGFVWKVYVSTWKSMFNQLVAYKNENPGPNSTFVPRKQYPKLGEWVNTQRTIYMRNELSPERVKLLESIGFVWKDINLNKWMDMFSLLVQYKEEHPGYKSTMVPNPYKKNPKLGEWVRTQRVMFTKNELSESRVKLLNSIGFVWKAYSSKWMEMYERLVEYKNQHHGSTIVPFKYEKDPSLGRWVGYNRSNCKDPDRIKLLNDIRFVWELPKSKVARANMFKPPPKQGTVATTATALNGSQSITEKPRPTMVTRMHRQHTGSRKQNV